MNMAITTGIHIHPVSIPCGFESLRGDLYLPRRAAAPAPVVLMAHDGDGDRRGSLPGHAWHFARRGMAVLVFEHAGLGDCAGTPRQWLDTDRHLAEYSAALDWLRRCPDVDGQRIALWGSQLEGGHVLVTAARHAPHVRAVVAQQPHLEGAYRNWAYPRRLRSGALWGVAFDLLASALVQPQPCIPVAPRRGAREDLPVNCGGRCRECVPAGATPINCVPARIRVSSDTYRPLRDARRIACPVLMVADSEAARSLPGVLKAAARIPDCRLEYLSPAAPGRPSSEALRGQVQLQAAFLREQLGMPPDLPAPRTAATRKRKPAAAG